MDPLPINLMDAGLFDNDSNRLLDMPPVIMGTGDAIVDEGLLASLGPGQITQAVLSAITHIFMDWGCDCRHNEAQRVGGRPRSRQRSVDESGEHALSG
eukprot:1891055-Rhodomonas_salina.1